MPPPLMNLSDAIHASISQATISKPLPPRTPAPAASTNGGATPAPADAKLQEKSAEAQALPTEPSADAPTAGNEDSQNS
jgi:hypothetical protein